MNIVAISGSLTCPSRTTTLVETILSRAQLHLRGTAELIEISALVPTLAAATDPANLPAPVRTAQQRLFDAELLIVGTPIYKASYTGLLKHFFDLLDPNGLRGKVALLAATGGSEHHALALEHQLRPLLSFFGVHTAPGTIYVKDGGFSRSADGSQYLLSDAQALQRIDTIVEQLTWPLLRRPDAALAAA
jgi:FMN reductase